MHHQRIDISSGSVEMKAVLRQAGGLMFSAVLFSVFVNLLMLTGPLFTLQIYDRVLISRSRESLVAIFILVVFLYSIMAVLDYARVRILARVGSRLQISLDTRVIEATLQQPAGQRNRLAHPGALRDLDFLQAFFSSPGFLALLDVFWTPVFLAAIFIFHPALGWLSIVGGGMLIGLTILNQLMTSNKTGAASTSSEQGLAFAAEAQMGREVVQSQGMRANMSARIRLMRIRALTQMMHANDRAGTFSALIKASRLLLQSTILAVGAWLVLQGQISAGAMIATAIIFGRALAPVEQAMGQWLHLQRARASWKSLARLLSDIPQRQPKTRLPTPGSELTVSGLTVVPPGGRTPAVRNVSFTLRPGQALGVIGPSGSGKSTLARALLGLWPPAAGQVRLGGATLDQYEPDDLGRHIGYLPQSVTLFNGSVAENIARMSSAPDSGAVVAAAKLANAHDLITGLEDGYDAFVAGNENQLSGGQRQRIALARALYGDPVLLILDEPNSALDAEGSSALNKSVKRLKSQGKSVIIMTHRPMAISECDHLIILKNGAMSAIGPRDEILNSMLSNGADIHPTPQKVPAN